MVIQATHVRCDRAEPRFTARHSAAGELSRRRQGRTLKNLSDWPAERIELLRAVLRGDALVPAGEGLEIVRALPHGHVLAALGRVTAKEVYATLDWLGAAQETIEGALARRHLSEGMLLLYDVTSTWLEGR